MKRVLISVGIGLALTVVFGIAAGMGAGAVCPIPDLRDAVIEALEP